MLSSIFGILEHEDLSRRSCRVICCACSSDVHANSSASGRGRWRKWFCPLEKLTFPTFPEQRSCKHWVKPLEICWKITIFTRKTSLHLWLPTRKQNNKNQFLYRLILMEEPSVNTVWRESFLSQSKESRILIKVVGSRWKLQTIQLDWLVVTTNSHLLHTFLIGNQEL